LDQLKAEVADIKGAQLVADSAAKGAQKSAITANNKIKELEKKLQGTIDRVDKLFHIIEFIFERVKQLEGDPAPTTNDNVTNDNYKAE